MTPMRRRRHVCFSLIVLGLCSLSMPNVGHVHGLSIPLNHRLFPAIAHAPHSSYPRFGPHPTLTHKRSQRAVTDIAAASEDDLLRKLLTLALQALRKRADDDEEDEEKDSNYDGYTEEDNYNDHHDDNDNEGRHDDEGEETNGDHNGDDSSHHS
ncbi:MAG: hypothetical protein BYD32DRAFT_436357 [Podila humilis]|nr:MAG: hypothetical protein BYD32DRAFT_436357 [Podila humilis]